MLILAPMAGITDLPFRLLCHEYGCDLSYTEMISAKGLLYNNKNTTDLLKTFPGEKATVQLFGSDPEILAEAACRLEEKGFEAVDINMGCPVPKIVKNGEGSALMKDPLLVEAIVKAIYRKIKSPVTVKIRKGFEGRQNAVEVAKAAESGGAAAVAVHGRMRKEYYSGKADWEIIKKVKESIQIPVYGNGDLFSPEDAKNLLVYTGCDGLMIGRGARGNPWIFKNCKEYFETGVYALPTLDEKISLALRHCRLLMEEGIRLVEMRKHFGWYFKGLKGAAQCRAKLNEAQSYADFNAICEEIKIADEKLG